MYISDAILSAAKNRATSSKSKIKFVPIPIIYIKLYYETWRGRVDDLSFFGYLSPFCFLLIEFHCTFSISYKIQKYYIYYIVFWLGYDRRSGLSFVPALFLSILTPLFLPSSYVSFSYFILAASMRECLREHSRMTSPFPIAILNGTFFFSFCESDA